MAAALFFWTAAMQEHLLFFGTFLMLVLAAIVGVFAERKRRVSKLLVTRGVATRGVVVNESISYGEGGEAYAWTVAYDTADGQRLTLALGESAVSPYDKRYGNVEVGYALTILYLSESPKRAMPYKECYYTAVPLVSDP